MSTFLFDAQKARELNAKLKNDEIWFVHDRDKGFYLDFDGQELYPYQMPLALEEHEEFLEALPKYFFDAIEAATILDLTLTDQKVKLQAIIERRQ